MCIMKVEQSWKFLVVNPGTTSPIRDPSIRTIKVRVTASKEAQGEELLLSLASEVQSGRSMP
jgi:hypothetical protein